MVRDPQPLRRLHILLVDSDPIGRDRIKQALGNGFAVRCASSQAEAMDCLETNLPDVLICEILLGQENGLDLCRSIRSTPSLRHLPIMLLTSLTTIQDKVAGFEAGADDYVVKPFDARHLVARIRLLSRIKRLELPDKT
ncbi:MAG: response regulator transcription factor [Chloroflexota bacterium]|nr:MAG: response regulator transcription factor [Chloroflexota bacterium]